MKGQRVINQPQKTLFIRNQKLCESCACIYTVEVSTIYTNNNKENTNIDNTDNTNNNTNSSVGS